MVDFSVSYSQCGQKEKWKNVWEKCVLHGLNAYLGPKLLHKRKYIVIMCIENEDHWSISLYLIHNANKRKKNKKNVWKLYVLQEWNICSGPKLFQERKYYYCYELYYQCRDQCGDFCITNTVPTKRAQRITFYSLAVSFTLTGNNKRNSIYFLFCWPRNQAFDNLTRVEFSLWK